MIYKYSFKKDLNGTADRVMLHQEGGAGKIFVCWLYPHEVTEGEKKSAAVDRMITAAGYEDRADYWQHNGKRIQY